MSAEVGGRELPGRFAFAGLDALRAVAAAAGLGLLVVVTRLPLRSHYLANWDATQFALGMQRFDLAHHQPHPPGYIGYIALGRLLLPLFGDANSTLVALSIAAEAAAVAVAFLFARAVFGRFAGWSAGLALLAAPLFWYYGEVANTYALEPLLVLLIAWPCWRLWQGEARFAYPAALALGLSGALRPSTMVLLTPVYLLALQRSASLPVGLRSLGIYALAAASWAVPLLILAGGPLRLLVASLQLGDSVTTGTAVWNDVRNPVLVTGNAILTGLGWELGLFAVWAVFGLLVAPRLLGRSVLSRDWSLFCGAWAAPGLLTFLFVHIGQVVYIQVFAPAIFLSLGPALLATAEAVGRPRLAPLLLAISVVVGGLIFFLPPRSLAEQLRLHDLRVVGLLALAAAEDPAHTVLVGDAYAVGSYRIVNYYLPDYPRIGLGRDSRQRVRQIYGELYDPNGGRHSRPLQFGDQTTTYVYLDRELLPLIADPNRLTRLTLPDGSAVYVWHGPPPEVIANQLWIDHSLQPGAKAIDS
jgi:hypothetical protein